jgi:hypothetical protein
MMACRGQMRIGSEKMAMANYKLMTGECEMDANSHGMDATE